MWTVREKRWLREYKGDNYWFCVFGFLRRRRGCQEHLASWDGERRRAQSRVSTAVDQKERALAGVQEPEWAMLACNTGQAHLHRSWPLWWRFQLSAARRPYQEFVCHVVASWKTDTLWGLTAVSLTAPIWRHSQVIRVHQPQPQWQWDSNKITHVSKTAGTKSPATWFLKM